MKRVGDHYHYDHPEQRESYHWTTYLATLFLASFMAFALNDTLPWHPWITFCAILAIAVGERLILRGKRR